MLIPEQAKPFCPMTYLERILAQGRDANPFFTLMGVELGDIGEGFATIRMKVRSDMMNGEEWLQGGIFTALADEAMVLAIYPMLDPGERIATITETTSFLAGAQTGTLSAAGRVVKRGRRVIFAEGEVTLEGSGRMLARCSAAYAVVKT